MPLLPHISPGSLIPVSYTHLDVAVADGNVLCIFETSQRIGGFQNDGVIPRGVDRALADAYVAAAVNVESVTVGIYFQIKQGEVLYTGGKQGEVSAMEHGEVFQCDIPAILEADRFVDVYKRQLYNHVCVGVSASVTRCRLLGIGVFSYLDMIRGSVSYTHLLPTQCTVS